MSSDTPDRAGALSMGVSARHDAPMMNAGGEPMRDPSDAERGLWRYVADVHRGRHLLVWLAVLELEADGERPINPAVVARALEHQTGEDVAEKNARRSMKKLQRDGWLSQGEYLHHPGGHHWTLTSDGRHGAHSIALALAQALECSEAVSALENYDPVANASADTDVTDSTDTKCKTTSSCSGDE